MNIFRIIKSPWWSISMIQNDSKHPWLKKQHQVFTKGFSHIYIYSPWLSLAAIGFQAGPIPWSFQKLMFQCRHTGSCPRLGTRVHGWVSPLGTWHENPIWGLVSGITTTSFCNFGKFKSISSRNHNLYKNGQLAGWINKSILATNTYFKKHLPNKIWNVNHSHPTDSLSQPQTNTPSPSNAVAKLAMADLPNSLDRATGCDSREVAKIGTLLPAGAEKSATTHLGFQLKFQLRLSKKLHPVVSSSLKFIRDTRPSLCRQYEMYLSMSTFVCSKPWYHSLLNIRTL